MWAECEYICILYVTRCTLLGSKLCVENYITVLTSTFSSKEQYGITSFIVKFSLQMLLIWNLTNSKVQIQRLSSCVALWDNTAFCYLVRACWMNKEFCYKWLYLLIQWCIICSYKYLMVTVYMKGIKLEFILNKIKI